MDKRNAGSTRAGRIWPPVRVRRMRSPHDEDLEFQSSPLPLFPSPTRFFLASGEDRRRKREGGKKKSCTNGPSVRSWTIRFGTIRIVTDRLFRNSFLLLDFWILGGGNLPDRGFYFIRAPSMETWRRILERNKILRWSTNICRSECATDCSSCFFFCPPVIISITRVLSTFGFSRVCKISRGVGEMECERRGIIRSPLLTSRYFI